MPVIQVFVGLENAFSSPIKFDVCRYLLGNQFENIRWIEEQTMCRLELKGTAEGSDPMYIEASHEDPKMVQKAKVLLKDLIRDVRLVYQSKGGEVDCANVEVLEMFEHQENVDRNIRQDDKGYLRGMLDLKGCFAKLSSHQSSEPFIQQLRQSCNIQAKKSQGNEETVKAIMEANAKNASKEDPVCNLCNQELTKGMVAHKNDTFHKKKYLENQLLLGFDQFSKLYCNEPIHDENTRGGTVLATHYLDAYFGDLDIWAVAVTKAYEESAILMGHLSCYNCLACQWQCDGVIRWIIHINSKKHLLSCVERMKEIDSYTTYTGAYGYMPCPTGAAVEILLFQETTATRILEAMQERQVMEADGVPSKSSHVNDENIQDYLQCTAWLQHGNFQISGCEKERLTVLQHLQSDEYEQWSLRDWLRVRNHLHRTFLSSYELHRDPNNNETNENTVKDILEHEDTVKNVPVDPRLQRRVVLEEQNVLPQLDSNVCLLFNQGVCTKAANPKCKDKHVCNACGGSHPAYHCKANEGGKNKTGTKVTHPVICQQYNALRCKNDTCSKVHQCYICGKQHPSFLCTSVTGPKKGKKLCYQFNLASCDETKQCQQTHRCYLCGNKQHCGLTCPERCYRLYKAPGSNTNRKPNLDHDDDILKDKKNSKNKTLIPGATPTTLPSATQAIPDGATQRIDATQMTTATALHNTRPDVVQVPLVMVPVPVGSVAAGVYVQQTVHTMVSHTVGYYQQPAVVTAPVRHWTPPVMPKPHLVAMPCFEYNRGACKLTNCPLPHQCAQCHGPHPRNSCPNMKRAY